MYKTDAPPRTTTVDGVPVFCSYDEIVKTKDLKPNPQNPNQHNAKQIGLLSNIITQAGWRAPITISKRSGYIVKGHGRRQAAIYANLKEVPVEYQEYSSEAEEHADLLADNRIAELADLDNEKLMDMIQDMDFGDMPVELTGFSNDDLTKILEELEGSDVAEDDGADAEPETDEEAPPFSKPGDLWILGEHRLLCGSATSEEDIARLMDGDVAQLVHTDPPYGVSFVGSGRGANKYGMIKNDDKTDDSLLELLVGAFKNYAKYTTPDAAFYIWHAFATRKDFEDAMEVVGIVPKQQIIWVKNNFVLAHNDYHWLHEPCQPAGTLVRTPNGDVPIETLKDGDRVLSFGNDIVQGYRNGFPVKATSRQYDGELYKISVGGKSTECTDGHRFSIRFRESDTWGTYLMRQGSRWRVGITRVITSRGFGLKDRLRAEKGDCAWLLDTFVDKTDAMVGEQILCIKYGIPTTHWNIQRGTPASHRTNAQIESIYDALDMDLLQEKAMQCLSDYGRRLEYPLCERMTGKTPLSRKSSSKVRACNIIPAIMELPVPYRQYKTGTNKTFDWMPVESVIRRKFSGKVYSLDVEKWHHYIADGIVTHNCYYSEKAGQHAKFVGDRSNVTAWRVTVRTGNDMATTVKGGVVLTDGDGHKITISDKTIKGKKMRYIRLKDDKSVFLYNEADNGTVWEFAKDTHPVHPTQKPVEIPAKAILNSTEAGEIVLDFFGGSGSTLIACEMTGRKCRTTELDPKYCDAIIKRYIEIASDSDVICHRYGNKYTYGEIQDVYKMEHPEVAVYTK